MNLFSERRISDHQSIGQTKKALGRRNRIVVYVKQCYG